MLYIVYQSQDEIAGDYMLCALFDAHLILAIPQTGSKCFKVVALIGTTDLQIETTNCSRGLSILQICPTRINLMIELRSTMSQHSLCLEDNLWF